MLYILYPHLPSLPSTTIFLSPLCPPKPGIQIPSSGQIQPLLLSELSQASFQELLEKGLPANWWSHSAVQCASLPLASLLHTSHTQSQEKTFWKIFKPLLNKFIST